MQIAEAGAPPRVIPIAWYRAPAGAKVLDVETAFAAGIWDRDRPELPPLVGEQPPYAAPWFNGENIWGYLGKCRIGTDRQFREGLTVADLAAIPLPIPACCAPSRSGQCWYLRNDLAAKNPGLPGVFVDPDWSNTGDPVTAGTLSDVPGSLLDVSPFNVVQPPNPITLRAVMQLITPPLPAQTIPACTWTIGIGRSTTLPLGEQKSLEIAISLLDKNGSLKTAIKSHFPIGPHPDHTGGLVAIGNGVTMPAVTIDFGEAICLEVGFSAFIFPPAPITWTLRLYDSGTIPIPIPSFASNLSPLSELCWPFTPVDPDMPIPGEIIAFGGPGLPAGYLVCDGSARSALAFPALFSAIGTSWGSVGPGTFLLPDLRDRTLLGLSPGGLSPTRPSARALADVGGEETHQLSVGELAAHNHVVTDPGHFHGQQGGGNFVGDNGLADAFGPGSDVTFTLSPSTTTDSTGITLTDTGADTAHNTMQPFASVQWLIKT